MKLSHCYEVNIVKNKYTLWLILLKQTTYPDDKNILFYYLSMSSLQNKTKNCLQDKFIFSHLQNPIVHIS